MAGEKFPVKQAERFCEDRGLSDRIIKIDGKVEKAKSVGLDKIFNQPDIIENRFITKIKRGYYLQLFQQENILDDFISLYWPIGRETRGKSHIKKCYGLMETVENYLKQRP